MKKKNKKVFIFDFDGTFYSGEHKFDNVKAGIDKNRRKFLKNISDEEYELICKENPKWLDIYVGIDLVNHLKMFKQKYSYLNISPRDFYEWEKDNIDDVIIDYEQIVDVVFLENLCDKYSVYVVSNSSQKHLKYYMDKLNIDYSWFKKVVSNEFLEEDLTKEHYYKDILCEEGCNAHDVYVFGDSVIADLAPALHLGMNAFYVDNSTNIKKLVSEIIPEQF